TQSPALRREAGVARYTTYRLGGMRDPPSASRLAYRAGPASNILPMRCGRVRDRMHFRQVKRREFITLLGGAAAWPLAARAQQAGKLPTIGFFGVATASAWGPWTAAFIQRLHELGWIEGRTIAIEYRWAEGQTDRFAEIAAELVRAQGDVIVTGQSPVTALSRATSAIPIVLALATDPIGTGTVASLAHPGGNVTGLSVQAPDLAGKRFELLHEIVPGLHRLAILGNIGFPAVV